MYPQLKINLAEKQKQKRGATEMDTRERAMDLLASTTQQCVESLITAQIWQ